MADGATTGLPNARRMLRATGWSGTRTAIVSSPAVASSATGQSGRLGSTSVSGPGQNAAASRSAAGVEAREPARRREVGHMRDQRIEGRPALGLVEARDRRAVGRVGAEPVDGLGRKGDEAAGGQHARGAFDRRAAGLDRSSMAARSLVCLGNTCACSPGRYAVIRPATSRSVAQSGSAPRSGRGGRRFKSCHSDHYLAEIETTFATGFATAWRDEWGTAL